MITLRQGKQTVLINQYDNLEDTIFNLLLDRKASKALLLFYNKKYQNGFYTLFLYIFKNQYNILKILSSIFNFRNKNQNITDFLS